MRVTCEVWGVASMSKRDKSSRGVVRRVGGRILTGLVLLRRRCLDLLRSMRFLLRRALCRTLLIMRMHDAMHVPFFAGRPLDDALVCFDQSEVVLRDEADLARQLVVDDPPCLDLQRWGRSRVVSRRKREERDAMTANSPNPHTAAQTR